MLHNAVADEAVVHKYVDRIAVELLHFGARDESVKAQRSRLCGLVIFGAPPWWRLGQSGALEFRLGDDGQQLVERLFAEDLVDALLMRLHWRRHQQRARLRVQLEMLVRMSQRIVRHETGDVR